MKTITLLVSGAISACSLVPGAVAQTSAVVGIQPHAGLTITGGVGTVYSIEYVPEISQVDDSNAWRCLEFLQLPASPYLWIDRSAPVSQRFYRAVEFTAPSNLVFVPSGAFRMGSSTTDPDRTSVEDPQTTVYFTQGFWIGKHEVTQGEYLAVVGENPSQFNGDLSRPVDSVSWEDATNYCALLTDRERAAGRISSSCLYRLPTEAEWEYACRSWTSTRFSYGDDLGYDDLANYAWFRANSEEMTHPVEQKTPNLWGLHDVHGNVWEWCQDGWSEELPGGILVDPDSRWATSRVLRGGSWYLEGKWSRSAVRMGFPRYLGLDDMGFRVVFSPQ